MPHEALWVEELLAHPTEAFGAAAHKECAVDLKHVRRSLNATLSAEKTAGEFVETSAEDAADGQPAGKGPKKERWAHTQRRDELQAVADVADELLDAWKPVDPGETGLRLGETLDFFILPEQRSAPRRARRAPPQ